jgi:hypothetical protein
VRTKITKLWNGYVIGCMLNGAGLLSSVLHETKTVLKYLEILL